MNKFSILTVIVLLGIFGALFYFIQQQPDQKPLPIEELLKTPNASPTSADEIVWKPTQAVVPTIDPLSLPTLATIQTSKGPIKLELYPDVAPKTVQNFAAKAKSGFYTDLTFHRVEDWVIQGGDPKGNGTGGGDMLTEFNNKPFEIGSLGVARGGDPRIQNDAQFFITKQAAGWLTGQYTNYGKVTEGMDVVEKIEIGDKILSITVE